MPKKSLSSRVRGKAPVTDVARQREIDRIWRESRRMSGIPLNLTADEQVYFVPVVVCVLRAHSKALSARQRALASRAA